MFPFCSFMLVSDRRIVRSKKATFIVIIRSEVFEQKEERKSRE
jgi:hypothetical protein